MLKRAVECVTQLCGLWPVQMYDSGGIPVDG